MKGEIKEQKTEIEAINRKIKYNSSPKFDDVNNNKHFNGINMPIKMQRLLEWLYKARSNSRLSTKMDFKYEEIGLNKIDGKSI